MVDPGPGQQVFDNLPGQLTLSVGAHILRYQATDASGNSTAVELRVVVTDTSVPTIEVADLPESGWFGGDASFVFRVGDDCGSPDDLQVTVEPEPSSMTREGNEYRVSYDQDGRYSLRITVTDDGGNSARENSVSFGIDRTPPEVSVAVPGQRGVDANDTVSYPFFGMGESLRAQCRCRRRGRWTAIRYSSHPCVRRSRRILRARAHGAGIRWRRFTHPWRQSCSEHRL